MSIRVAVSSPDLIAQIKAIEGMEKVAEEEFKKAARHVAPLAKALMSSNAPVGVTGRTRSDISTRVSGTGYKVKGQIGYLAKSAVWYPNVIEYGRTSTKMPPPSALLSWVEVRTGATGKEAERMAFLISRAIARQGIKGRGFVKSTFETIKPAADAAFGVANEQIAQKLAVHGSGTPFKSEGGAA